MAKHVEIRLALPVVGPLVEFIMPLLDSDRGELPAVQNLEGIDKELRESWRNDLLAAHDGDLAVFRGLFGEHFRTTGVIEFPETECEPIVRACSSVRLRLRSGFLSGIKDEALEGGEFDHETLDPDEQTGFMAYVFLASFQEILIRRMDPGIGEG